MASTLCVYCDFIRYTICAVYSINAESYPLNQIMCIADFLLFVGDGAFYTLAIYRLYISFLDTVYMIRRSVIHLFTAMILVQCVAALYYCVFVALQPKSPENANAFFARFLTPVVALLAINDLILNGSLLMLFVSKLRASLTDTLVSNSIEQIGSSLDTISNTMVDVICRHSLLFGFAIISNQLFFISNINVFLLWRNIDDLHFTVFCCRALENVSKSLVLFLGLKQNRHFYTKMCMQCHKGLAFCFVQSTQQKVNEELESRRSQLQYRQLSGSESEKRVI